MYQFCRTFRCTPEEYYRQMADDVDLLLVVEHQIKLYEEEEMKKDSRRHSQS